MPKKHGPPSVWYGPEGKLPCASGRTVRRRLVRVARTHSTEALGRYRGQLSLWAGHSRS